MRLDGTYTATVDRIVEGQAVLLVESDGETVDERHCPAFELPDAAGEGAVCELTFEDDELVDLAYRPETTSDRRRRMREKFDSLSRRLGDDGDERGSSGGEADEGGSRGGGNVEGGSGDSDVDGSDGDVEGGSGDSDVDGSDGDVQGPGSGADDGGDAGSDDDREQTGDGDERG